MAGTVIKRSIFGTIVLAALSLAIGFGAFKVYEAGHFWWGIGLACVAVACGIAAFRGPQTVKCPYCNRALSPIYGSEFCCCEACGEYSQRKDNTMVRLAPDYIHSGIAPFNVFLTGLTTPVYVAGARTRHVRDLRWPDICILCSAPPTETALVEGVARGRDADEDDLHLSVNVPKCVGCVVRVHKMPSSEIWYGPGFAFDSNSMSFSSYRFWREFCRLNGIDQRRSY